MNSKLALTIDFGTQSLRVALINKKGDIVAMEKRPYGEPYFSTQKGYAEQHANFYWDILVEAMTTLCQKNKELLPNILGATVTTFRDTAVLLDSNYEPLRPCILWLDQRSAKVKEKLPLIHNLLFFIVGMSNTIFFNRKRTAAHWVKENEPEVWSKTKKYVNISTYITYKLSNKLVDSVSNFTGHYPLCYRKKKWYKEGALKGRIFGVPNRMLCEIKDAGEPLCTISDEFAEQVGLPKGIVIYASGSDKACETLGNGALDPTIASISYGTASSIEISNKKYYEPETFLPSYPAAVKNWYNMDVQIYRGYWMITWFTKEFASNPIGEKGIMDMTTIDMLNSRLTDIPPGSDGLIVQPYWGPGLKRPLAKGAIVGFSDVHTREHMYKAIIEGIAYALREGMEGIEKKQRQKIKEIRISGGGSQSSAICQITSDIFGLPVSKIHTHESTSLGAAMAIFLATKEFETPEEAIAAMTHVTETFDPNPVANQQYEYLYKKAYLKLYPDLKEVYADLKKFDKKF